jgi:broad specificity phosphatase PhoE
MSGDFTSLKIKELSKYMDTFLNHELSDPLNRKLLLVRHGQSYGNKKELIYGDLDFELTPLGKQQAGQVKETFNGVLGHVTTFSVSEKLRSQQTGLIVLGQDSRVSSTPLPHGYREKVGSIDFRVDKRFNEFNLGRLEGIDCSKLTYSEQEALNRHFLEGKLIHETIESPDALFTRVSEGFADLPAGEKSNNVIVGHYGIVHVFLGRLGYQGVPISTGDSIFLELNPDGTPQQLVAYWTK